MLEALFIKGAIIPAIYTGLLGDLSKIIVCSDGSALPIGRLLAKVTFYVIYTIGLLCLIFGCANY